MLSAATPAPLARLWDEVKDFTLSDVLMAFGYRHEPGGFQARRILAGDVQVFYGSAGEAWKWLRSRLGVQS